MTTRLLVGLTLSFLLGAGCRWFDIPVPSPPVIPGALLVLAMTLGYSSVDRFRAKHVGVATTKALCGGPTGQTPEPSSAVSSIQAFQTNGGIRERS